MQCLVLFITAVVLLTIAFEDFKNRTVHVFLFPVLFTLSVVYAFYELDSSTVLKNIGVSFCFLALQGILLVSYFIIKHAKWINITDQYLGWGDILFMLAVLPFFSPLAYVLFYLSSLMFTIVFVLMCKMMLKEMKFIPLAGIQALYLLIVLYYHQFVSAVLWEDFLPLTL